MNQIRLVMTVSGCDLQILTSENGPIGVVLVCTMPFVNFTQMYQKEKLKNLFYQTKEDVKKDGGNLQDIATKNLD